MNGLISKLTKINDSSSFESSKMTQHIKKIADINKSREYEYNFASENENILEKSLVNISSELEEIAKVVEKKSEAPSIINDSNNASVGENLSWEKTSFTDKKMVNLKKLNSRTNSIDNNHTRKTSQEDSKSIIVYGGNDFSMNNSCIEDFEQFADLKSQLSIDNKNAPNDDIAEEVSFTRILEVDEEYYGSNCTTERTNNNDQNQFDKNAYQQFNDKLNNQLTQALILPKKQDRSSIDSTLSTSDKKSSMSSSSSVIMTQNKFKNTKTIKVKSKEGKGLIEIPKLNLSGIKNNLQ